jgi:transposase
MRSRVSEGWLRSWGQTSQPRPKYNERIEKLALANYPQVALLKQVKGVGTLITLTFLLTLEDAHRFRKSRDVGCYLGLQPGRRNSTPGSGDCVNRLAQLLFLRREA